MYLLRLQDGLYFVVNFYAQSFFLQIEELFNDMKNHYLEYVHALTMMIW